jgi:hypothetical protein
MTTRGKTTLPHKEKSTPKLANKFHNASLALYAGTTYLHGNMR